MLKQLQRTVANLSIQVQNLPLSRDSMSAVVNETTTMGTAQKLPDNDNVDLFEQFELYFANEADKFSTSQSKSAYIVNVNGVPQHSAEQAVAAVMADKIFPLSSILPILRLKEDEVVSRRTQTVQLEIVSQRCLLRS